MSATQLKRGKHHELGLDLHEAEFLNDMLGDSLAEDSGGESPHPQHVPEPAGGTDQQGASARCSSPAGEPEVEAEADLETDPVATIQPLFTKMRQHYKKPPAPVSLRAHSVPCGAMAHVPDSVSPTFKQSQSGHYAYHTYAATSVSTSPSIPHQQSTQSSHARKVSRGSDSALTTAVSAIELVQADSVVPPSMRAAMNLYLAPPPAYMHLSPSRLHTASLTRIFHEASASSGLFDYPSTLSLAEQESGSPATILQRKLSPTSADTSCSVLITARLADSLRGLEAEFSASIRQDGSAHPHSLALARQLCFQYNSTGVKLMEVKQMAAALQLLQKAQLLVEGGGMLDAQASHQSRLQVGYLVGYFSNMSLVQAERTPKCCMVLRTCVTACVPPAKAYRLSRHSFLFDAGCSWLSKPAREGFRQEPASHDLAKRTPVKRNSTSDECTQ